MTAPGRVDGGSGTPPDETRASLGNPGPGGGQELALALLESLGDAVFACDAAGQVAFLNRAARGWHGLGAERLPLEEWVETSGFFLADGTTPFPAAEFPLARALRGESVRDVEMVVRSGSQKPRRVLAAAVPSGAGAGCGREEAALLVLRDVTAGRETAEALERREKELQESERKFELFMENLPSAAFIKDGILKTVFANRALRETTRAAEMLGKTVEELYPPEVAHQMMSDDRRALAGHHVVRMERIVDARGRERMFRTFRFPIPREAGGNLVGGIAVDVTEEVRAQREAVGLSAEMEERVRRRTAELEDAVREVEGFSYSVSHDLRAPLRAIDGFSGRLLAGYGDRLDAEGKRFLEAVRTNAVHMGRLIDDLLEFSRAGRGELQRGPVDMAALVRLALDDIRSADPDATAGVEIRVGELPGAEGDSALLRKVWACLLGNALKFTRPKESRLVEVAGREEGGRRVYAVRDNGVGFDMKYVEKLFGVFQRLHGTRGFEGTGVGLALVRRIVVRHGGEVRADGREGEGAEFSFTLP